MKQIPRMWNSARALADGKRLAATLVVALLLFPPNANGAGLPDIISFLRTITSTLQNVIGGTLNEMRSLNAAVNQFRQQVVWPTTVINQTKGFVSSISGQYKGILSQIQHLPANSATLANPAQLETLFRSASLNNLSQVQPQFKKLYSAVPQSTDAQALDRNVMDIDDAMAVGSLKTAMISDQTSQTMLNLADTLEQQAATASPGSADLLAAQARIANLENQAYFGRMLAAELRQSAAHLAHENAALKKSADTTHRLRMQLQQILTRP
jgi:hypothetical protein